MVNTGELPNRGPIKDQSIIPQQQPLVDQQPVKRKGTLSRRRVLQAGAVGFGLLATGGLAAYALGSRSGSNAGVPEGETPLEGGGTSSSSGGTPPSVSGETSPSSQPSPKATAVATEKPQVQNEIKYVFNENVSAADRQYIQNGAEIARAFYHRELGLYLPVDVTYNVISDPSIKTLAISGTVASPMITLNVANPGWAQRNSVEKTETAVHEPFHIVQNFLSSKQFLSSGPFFMGEGSAEYAGFAGVVDAGLISNQEVKQRELMLAKISKEKLPPLLSIDRNTPGNTYALSYLAMDFLLGDKGLKKLGEYYKNVRTLPWEDAFAKTFGETPDTFQSRFESWRAASTV